MFKSLSSTTTAGGWIPAARILLSSSWSIRGLHSDLPLREGFNSPSTPSKSNTTTRNNHNNHTAHSNGDNNRFAKQFERKTNTRNFVNRNSNTSTDPKRFYPNINRNNHNNNPTKAHSPDYKRPQFKSQHQPQRRESPQFVFDTGSRQAINALKAFIEKVAKLRTNFKVRYLNPEDNSIDFHHLSKITNNLELDRYGLTLIQHDNEELPLIKRIDVVDMVRAYSDELAAIKEKELIESGSRAAQKAVQARNKVLKKKSTKKDFTISFNISLGDLVTQKRREVLNLINKGDAFNIILICKSKYFKDPAVRIVRGGPPVETEVGSGGTITKATHDIRYNRAFQDAGALEVELARREMIYEQLLVYLDECPCTYTVEGTLYNKFIISIVPKESELSSTNDEHRSNKEDDEKELKKQKKLLKQKEREEVKKQETKSDEDLDALYSFKIDP